MDNASDSTETNYIPNENLQAPKDCPVCGWAADSVHTEVHRSRCVQWRKACEDMQYWPTLRAKVREDLQSARDLQKKAETDIEHFDADFNLVAAYFDRSLGSAIDDGTYAEHPQFDDYACMVDLKSFGSIYRERYPLQEGEIAQGFTLWHPAESRARRSQFRLAHKRSE